MEHSDLPRELSTKLREFDIDKNDSIDVKELTSLLQDFYRTREFNVLFKRIIIALVIMMFLLVASITAMTFVVVDQNKDTNVQGSVLVDRETGEAIQCANTDTTITNGVLSNRKTPSRRRLEDTTDPSSSYADLANLDSPVQVSLNMNHFIGTSDISPSDYSNIASVSFWDKLGEDRFYSFEVVGVYAENNIGATDGKYLNFVTSVGTLAFDQTDIFYKNDPEGVFAGAGLNVITPVAARKLQNGQGGAKPGGSIAVRGPPNPAPAGSQQQGNLPTASPGQKPPPGAPPSGGQTKTAAIRQKK